MHDINRANWDTWAAAHGQDGYYGQGHIGVCTRYDAATAKAFKAFRDAYRNKGPEGIPSSANQPGMGPS